MLDDDKYTRITLRIPKDLHGKLDEEADRTSKSLNAEIVARLQESFANTERLASLEATLLNKDDAIATYIRSGRRTQSRIDELERELVGLKAQEARVPDLLAQIDDLKRLVAWGAESRSAKAIEHATQQMELARANELRYRREREEAETQLGVKEAEIRDLKHRLDWERKRVKQLETATASADFRRSIEIGVVAIEARKETLNLRIDIVKSRLESLQLRSRVISADVERLAKQAETDGDFDKAEQEMLELRHIEGQVVEQRQELKLIVEERDRILERIDQMRGSLQDVRGTLESGIAAYLAERGEDQAGTVSNATSMVHESDASEAIVNGPIEKKHRPTGPWWDRGFEETHFSVLDNSHEVWQLTIADDQVRPGDVALIVSEIKDLVSKMDAHDATFWIVLQGARIPKSVEGAIVRLEHEGVGLVVTLQGKSTLSSPDRFPRSFMAALRKATRQGMAWCPFEQKLMHLKSGLQEQDEVPRSAVGPKKK